MKKGPTFFLFSEQSNNKALEAMSGDKVLIREFDKTQSGQLWTKEENADKRFTLTSELEQSKILTAIDQDLKIEGNL